MLPRERVLSLFEGKQPDKIPIHNISFSSYAASLIIGREAYVGGGIQQWREACALWDGEESHREFIERCEKDAFDLSVAMNHDILRLDYWRKNVKPAKKLDEYTFLYGNQETEWQIWKFDPETEMYQKVDSSAASTRNSSEGLEATVATLGKKAEDFSPSAELVAQLETRRQLYGSRYALRTGGVPMGIPYGSAPWMEATLLKPDLVGRYLDGLVVRARNTIPVYAEYGVKTVFGGGDFASNSGPFYSPAVFHNLLLPRLRIITDICHKYGIYYLFGSDGNLWPVAEDLFRQSGIDGYYEIDRRAGMDLARLRQNYPNLVLIGNISSHTMHRGSKDDVIRETMSCLQAAKQFGKMAIGCSNVIVPGTPFENIFALLETLSDNR